MQRAIVTVFIVTASILLACGEAAAQRPVSLDPPTYGVGPERADPPVALVMPLNASAQRPNLGGGFIEFLFSGGEQRAVPQQPVARAPQPVYASIDPNAQQALLQSQVDPQYMKQEVDYPTTEPPGTVVIDTPQRFLFLVEHGGKAIRYGIGVGRPGFTWAGVHNISAKKEWPDWVPPDQMLERQPGLPHFMAGGPNNPLGARAMYLGSTLYRIHGSNEPWTIGHMVSSGCIRMRNVDVIDLYDRVKVGTKVVVL